MLLAVLEKHAGFMLGAKDVFLNITGGIKQMIRTRFSGNCSCLKQQRRFSHFEKYCFAIEIGLSGEIKTHSSN